MIKGLFWDMGGVLLTNGWDQALRKKAAQKFKLDFERMSERHSLIFDLFERGKLTFDAYLEWTVFDQKREFTKEQFKAFILEAAKPFDDMITFAQEIKSKHNVCMAALSNEGKEIGEDRIKRFNLASFLDFFVISGCVQLRKPDHAIYELALSLMQLKPEEICYIDDRALLVEVARDLKLNAIHHTSFETTKAQVGKLLNGI